MAELPHKIVERLANSALEFPAAELESLINRSLAATDDVGIKSRLIWIGGMYLERHPGAFTLDRPLVEQFLQSTEFDPLLAGLKGIQHCNATADEIVSHFLFVMRRVDWEHRLAALYQLSN